MDDLKICIVKKLYNFRNFNHFKQTLFISLKIIQQVFKIYSISVVINTLPKHWCKSDYWRFYFYSCAVNQPNNETIPMHIY